MSINTSSGKYQLLKEAATRSLIERRHKHLSRVQINNSKLRADSPMYFYCASCGAISDIVEENWFLALPRRLCGECNAMKGMGWL